MSSLQTRYEALVQKTSRYGQEHTLSFWNRLADEDKESLANQLESIDFDLVQGLISSFLPQTEENRTAMSAKNNVQAFIPPTSEDLEKFQAEKVYLSRYSASVAEEVKASAELGRDALRNNRVAAFVVAGGQGSRLGFHAPKGMFPVGPVTDRTLFQIFADQIKAVRKEYDCSMPWLVMTSRTPGASEDNHSMTEKYFAEQNYFGLGKETVRIFPQENLPAVDSSGRILMKSTHLLSWSPNGHGGSLKALFDSGSLHWLNEQGIDVVSYYQVDNPLVRIADPVFIGRHLSVGSDMSSKVLRKRDWKEKLGVVGRLRGKPSVVEYSDLPDAVAQAEDDEGNLIHWAGSIAIHLLTVDFALGLGKGGFQLPYHKAEKAVPCIDADGKQMQLQADEKNGVKFELFVFDALPMVKTTMTMETEREEEFAPIKNAEGLDSPESARLMLTDLYAKWLKNSGHNVPKDSSNQPDCVLEISPQTSLEGEGLEDLEVEIPSGAFWKV